MNLRDDFRTARRLSGKEWRLLVEAGGLLVIARLAVWFAPFRELATRLGCGAVGRRALHDVGGWHHVLLGRRPGREEDSAGSLIAFRSKANIPLTGELPVL